MAEDGRIEINTRINNDGVDQGIQKIKSSIETAADSCKKTGETMSKYLTLPLIAIGGIAFKTASDFDSAQGRMQAQLGITSEEAKKLSGIAKELWKNGFGEDVNEAADAVALVHKNLQNVTGEELKSATESAFVLRDTFEYDLSESTRAAKALMDNFGISSTKAFDYITRGAQLGGDYSQELLDTISEYSTYFVTMGMDAQDMFNVLVKGAKSGAWNLDKVGDAVKEFNVRAKDGSKTTSEGFAAINMDAKKMGQTIATGGEEGKKAFMATITALSQMKDPVAQNAAGVALFGTQWEDLEATVMTSLNSTTDELGTVEGATKKAGDTLYDNIGAKATAMWRETQAALEPIGVILLDIAEKILPYVSKAIKNLSQWFSNLSPSGQTFIAIIGLISAAIGPLLIFFGSLASSILTLGPLLFGTAESAGLLSTVFATLTGPIGIVMAAIVALGALFIYLWNTSDGFKNAIITGWEAIKSAAIASWGFILNSVLLPIWNAILAFGQEIFGKFQAFWAKNGAEIMNIVQTAYSIISTIIKGQMEYIKGIFQAVWPIISGIVKIAWNLIKLVITNTITVIMGIIKTILALILGDWEGAWNSILGIAKGIWKNIEGFFKNVDLVQIGKDIINGLIKGIGSMAKAVDKTVKGIAGTIKDTIADALDTHSPSRWMRDEIGKNMMLGWQIGIDKEKSSTLAKTNDMISWMTPEKLLGGAFAVPSLSTVNNSSSKSIDNSRGDVNVNVYPKEASIDEKVVLRSFERAVLLHG